MKKTIIAFAFILLSFVLYSQVDSSFYTVRLSSFELSSNNNLVKLNWKVSCFIEYANFEIQKSTDGNNFTTSKSFSADRLRCQQPFDFADTLLNTRAKVFYRINVGNIDGKFYHSAVRFATLSAEGFDLIAVYPTLVNNILNFSVSSSKNDLLLAFIINQNGIIVKREQLTVSKGISTFHFQTLNLSTGNYWLKVWNNEGQFKTSQFIISR
jgi:hypothetical protein